MKLRQSLANIKRPKLEEKPTLEPNYRPSNTAGMTEHATEQPSSREAMQDSTEETMTTDKPLTTEKILGRTVERPPGGVRTAKATSSLGIVEMQNDEMGQLGSLCFRRNVTGNFYSESIYTPCNMMGGKLRKLYRGTNKESVLLTGRRKNKDLLVRCESIMIYPKVLIDQKERSDKSEKEDNHQQVVSNLEKHKFASRPIEAWNASEPSLTVTPKTSEANHNQLPQLNVKDHTTPRGHAQIPAPETSLDTPDEKPALDSVQNHATSTDLQVNKNSATTQIIIPFGENELRNQTVEGIRSKSGHVGGERGAPVKTRCIIKETPTLQKVQGVVSHKSGFSQQQGVEGSATKAAGERNGGTPMKSRCLKESSRLNEKMHSTQPDLVLDVRESGMARKLVITTQYQILNPPNSPLKKFQIPTAIDRRELFAGRENYPPRNKTASFRLAHHQRGLSEYSNKSVESSVEGSCGQSLKIGGKGLLNARLSTLSRHDEKLVEEESQKRVQFLVRNSRYFT